VAQGYLRKKEKPAENLPDQAAQTRSEGGWVGFCFTDCLRSPNRQTSTGFGLLSHWLYYSNGAISTHPAIQHAKSNSKTRQGVSRIHPVIFNLMNNELLNLLQTDHAG